jgi:hypothetical protein
MWNEALILSRTILRVSLRILTTEHQFCLESICEVFSLRHQFNFRAMLFRCSLLSGLENTPADEDWSRQDTLSHEITYINTIIR